MSTVTALNPETLLAALEVGIEAASGALPAASGSWSVERVDSAAPIGDGQAVTATLAGIGTVSMVFAPRLARQLQVGPPPADDLLEGATPAMEALAAVVSRTVGTSAVLGDPREVSGGSVERVPAGHSGFVFHLYDGTDHAASLIVAVPLTSLAPAGGAEIIGPGDYEQFEPVSPVGASDVPVTVLHDVELGVTVELGRTKMLVRDVLSLTIGSVVELDRAAGSPVDVYVNGTLIARGEVVVVDEEFGVRITEVIGYHQDKTRR